MIAAASFPAAGRRRSLGDPDFWIEGTLWGWVEVGRDHKASPSNTEPPALAGWDLLLQRLPHPAELVYVDQH